LWAERQANLLHDETKDDSHRFGKNQRTKPSPTFSARCRRRSPISPNKRSKTLLAEKNRGRACKILANI